MIFCINNDILPKVRFIGFVNYDTPWQHFSRQIDEYIMYVIESGEMYLTEGQEDYVLRAGDFFLLEPNKVHVGYKKARCRYHYIHFTHSDLHPTTEDSEAISKLMLDKRQQSLASDQYVEEMPTAPVSYLQKHFNMNDRLLFMGIQQGLKEAIADYESKVEDYKRYASSRFYEVLIKMCRAFATAKLLDEKHKLPRIHITVQNVTDYINREYPNKITREDIEETFELNYDYLNRNFKSITGYTLHHYLNVVRINKAKELIANTSLHMSEIGYLVGIDDPYYFSRLFKKYVGVSPSKYTE